MVIDKIKTYPNWGVLFDLDGVLIDSEGAYTEFWHQIDRHYITGVKDFEYVIKGNTLGNILKTYFPDYKIQNEIKKALFQFEDVMDYTLFEGVEELLESLYNAGIRSAIVTSSNKKKMKRLLSQLPCLKNLIAEIITEDDISLPKPHPEAYIKGAERLNIDSKRCIVFEDSVAGVQAGSRSGAYVIGITTTNPASVLEPFSDKLISSIKEINLAILQNIFADGPTLPL